MWYLKYEFGLKSLPDIKKNLNRPEKKTLRVSLIYSETLKRFFFVLDVIKYLVYTRFCKTNPIYAILKGIIYILTT